MKDPYVKGQKVMNDIFRLSLKVYEKTLASEITSIKPFNEIGDITIPEHWFKKSENEYNEIL